MVNNRSFARNLAISFSVFVLLGSLAIAGWMTWRHQHQSLDELNKLAATNASFIAELRLPKSRELAKQLSHILDAGVGFHFKNGESGDWPLELSDTINELTSRRSPSVVRAHGYAIAIAPFSDDNTSLILIRESERLFPDLAGVILAPAALFTLTCAVLAVLIGRGIVRPLAVLVDWLPNLNIEPDRNPDPLPLAITTRRDEIGMLAQALEQTSKDLRNEQQLRRQSERLATLGRIATSLAHEIRNPAAAIGLHADLLAGKAEGTDAESIELIREEVDRITDLVNQWLFVARSAPTQKEPHDLCELLENVCRRLRPVLEHARAKLTIELPDSSPVLILVDAPRMEQAIRNLLMNAAQAMPEGGVIHAILNTEQGLATLSIEDDGKGFSNEALRRFDEPFFSEREGGMGIGLTLASEVIQAHGGTLEPGKASSRKGACVVFNLPLISIVDDKL